MTNTDEINKIVRLEIINYLNITGNRVLNGVSVRGPNLQKIISECTLGSFNLEDSFIVFDLEKANGEDYFVMEEDDNTVSVISEFQMNFRVYGMLCHMIGLRLQAMFKDVYVLGRLYEKGIRGQDVTDLTTINEFINNTMWPRADLSFKMQIRFTIYKKDAGYFEDNPEEVFKNIIIHTT